MQLRKINVALNSEVTEVALVSSTNCKIRLVHFIVSPGLTDKGDSLILGCLQTFWVL